MNDTTPGFTVGARLLVALALVPLAAGCAQGDGPETFDGKVIRMTTDGRFSEWAAGEDAAGIGYGSATQMTAASDGAMWFAAPAGNRIGRIPCGG